MLNYLNAAKQQNIGNNNNLQAQNAQNSQNPASLQNLANGNAQMLQNLSTNVFSKTPSDFLINKTEQSNLQNVLKMDNEVVQKYLQSLLDMPESLDKFLKAINIKDKNSQSYQFLKLFVENMINNKELSQLLKQNSNDAIQKLLAVITQSLKQNSADTGQLKEILSVLNVIHSSSSLNTNTLRELFLLYIPINYQVYKENSNFDKITSDNEESIKESILSILFETYNFSNILITLCDNNNTVTVELHASLDFPYDKFKKIITSYAKDNSINVLCDFLKIKDGQSRGQKQNFKIISNYFVPINILNISHIVIKTIFKIDFDLSESI